MKRLYALILILLFLFIFFKSSQAGEFTKLLIEVVNPQVNGFRIPITVTCEDQELESFRHTYPDNFRYEVKFLIKDDNNILEPHKRVTVKVYQGSEAQGVPLYEVEIPLRMGTYLYVRIHLNICTTPGETGCLDPDIIASHSYENKIIGWQVEIELPGYPWNANNPLPGGDMDASFPPDGDFDGDRITNYDEHLFSTSGIYPTIPLFVKRGINLYYFPSIEERPYIGQLQEFYFDPNSPNDPNSAWNMKDPNQGNLYGIDCCFYDQEEKVWEREESVRLTSNTFNAIDAQRPGILYLNLTALDYPMLCLRGFVDPEYFHQENLNPCDYLDTNLPDPAHFDTNVSTLEVLNTLSPLAIETIRWQHFKKGSWEASYRFFGRSAGEDMCLMPDQVYVIDKKKGR